MGFCFLRSLHNLWLLGYPRVSITSSSQKLFCFFHHFLLWWFSFLPSSSQSSLICFFASSNVSVQREKELFFYFSFPTLAFLFNFFLSSQSSLLVDTLSPLLVLAYHLPPVQGALGMDARNSTISLGKP